MINLLPPVSNFTGQDFQFTFHLNLSVIFSIASLIRLRLWRVQIEFHMKKGDLIKWNPFISILILRRSIEFFLVNRPAGTFSNHLIRIAYWQGNQSNRYRFILNISRFIEHGWNPALRPIPLSKAKRGNLLTTFWRRLQIVQLVEWKRNHRRRRRRRGKWRDEEKKQKKIDGRTRDAIWTMNWSVSGYGSAGKWRHNGWPCPAEENIDDLWPVRDRATRVTANIYRALLSFHAAILLSSECFFSLSLAFFVSLRSPFFFLFIGGWRNSRMSSPPSFLFESVLWIIVVLLIFAFFITSGRLSLLFLETLASEFRGNYELPHKTACLMRGPFT